MVRASQTYAGQLHDSLSGPDGEIDFSHKQAIAYLREHAIEQHAAIKYELGYVKSALPGDERFQGMLSIPYDTPTGIVALKFRSFGVAAGKYAQYHGQKARLYNSQAYFDAGDTIGICEGEMDAIAATEYLEIPSVGVPGATSWNRDWTPLFRDFQRVIIYADGDQPGRDFAQDVAESIGWRAQIVRCPDGEDVSSMCAAGRMDEITSKRDDE